MIRSASRTAVGIVTVALVVVVFLLPFVYIVLQSMKTPADAARLQFTLPEVWQGWTNLIEVVTIDGGVFGRALLNSTILTVVSVVVLVVLAAMVGFVLQRRPNRLSRVVNFFLLAGLIVPPAVVPTVWVLQGLGLFKTMGGLILVEIAYGLAFCILLFRAFVAAIPRELDEAAIMDGAGVFRLFFQVILPLLRPVMITVIVVQAVAVFNDFANPLYFLPGTGNETVQLTLFGFQSRTLNQYNLLFMDILLITIPPLILYIFFNRKIVEGMTSGAVKG